MPFNDLFFLLVISPTGVLSNVAPLLTIAASRFSQPGVSSEPECEEELRPWVRQFVRLLILLALVGAGYYVYHVSVVICSS